MATVAFNKPISNAAASVGSQPASSRGIISSCPRLGSSANKISRPRRGGSARFSFVLSAARGSLFTLPWKERVPQRRWCQAWGRWAVQRPVLARGLGLWRTGGEAAGQGRPKAMLSPWEAASGGWQGTLALPGALYPGYRVQLGVLDPSWVWLLLL